MIETFSKNYTYMNFDELIEDITALYDWVKIITSDDGTYVRFYANERESYLHIFKQSSNNTIGYKVAKNGVWVINTNSNVALMTRFVKTSKVSCIAMYQNNSIRELSPTDYWNVYMVGRGINQLTKKEEVVECYGQQYARNFNNFIISDDNFTENIALIPINTISNNLNAKCTTMQNVFYKNSECIMKDVYVLTSVQLVELSFTECTLNDKKYYMLGTLMLAD